VKIYLIRHGETALSSNGLYADGARLTKRGRRQARALADILLDFGVTRLIISGLRRAFETARPFQRSSGLEVQVLPGLNEISIGWLREAPIEQLVQRTADGDWQLFFEEFGGESAAGFSERVCQSFQAMTDCSSEDTVLAVIVHGGVINVIMDLLNGQLFDGRLRYVLPNGSLTLVEGTPDALKIGFIGATGHLIGPTTPRS